MTNIVFGLAFLCLKCMQLQFIQIYEEELLLLKSEGLAALFFPLTPKGASSDQLRCGQLTSSSDNSHHRNQYSLIYLNIDFSHLLPVSDYQRTGYIKKRSSKHKLWHVCILLVHHCLNCIHRETPTVLNTFQKYSYIFSQWSSVSWFSQIPQEPDNIFDR